MRRMVQQRAESGTPTTSLRIYTLSGAELRDLPEIPDRATAGHLKTQLQITHGIPRFRVKLFSGTDSLQDQHEIALPAQLHLVLLSYIPATHENVLELIQACDQGERAQVARILQRPQDVNALLPLPNNNDQDTSDGDSECGDRVVTALQAAARENYEDIIELLLEAHADLHAPGNNTALWWAAAKDSRHALRTLLHARAEPNNTNARGETALLEAAWRNHDIAANLLIQARANLDSRDNHDRTALVAACIADSRDVAISLLCVRADFMQLIQHEDTTPVSKTTAMCAAAAANHLDALEALLEADACIEAAGDSQVTPLWHAAKEGTAEAVELLLRRKANPNADNYALPERGSALCAAASRGHNAVITLLLAARANPNFLCSFNETPLIKAYMYGKADTARLLLHAKADFGRPSPHQMSRRDTDRVQATMHRWAQDLLPSKAKRQRPEGKRGSWYLGPFARQARRKQTMPSTRRAHKKQRTGRDDNKRSPTSAANAFEVSH